ncbi:MAG: hypothetical protein J7M38_07275 [Armatimonadetes bacterium]|nr:hypothetical protein [Armatimonadota bacterium]
MARKTDIPADLFHDTEQDGDAGEEQEKNAKKAKPRSVVKLKRPKKRGSSRVGRPPSLEGPKEPVTLYLTQPAAHRLEEARYLLLTEHGVKTTRSALADYALRHGLEDLAEVAEELGRGQEE